MRTFLAAVCFLFIGSAISMADDRSVAASWWATLSDDERIDIQGYLVLLGHYDALVDGEFGPATFRAIEAYQSRLNIYPNGILDAVQLNWLRKDGDREFATLGIAAAEDARSGVAAFIPRAILTEVTAEAEGGVKYSTPDGEFEFFLQGWDLLSVPFADVSGLILTPAEGKSITYRSSNDHRVVASGMWNGRSYYWTAAVDAKTTVGFYVVWTDRYADVALRTAIFAASYSGRSELFTTDPAKENSDSPDSTGAAEPSKGQQIGPFYLADDEPTVVHMNSDIEAGAALEFRRVMKARPGTTTLMLESNGGSVNEGLLVAHEVADLGLGTVVPAGSGCYSACAYVFFAGKTRVVAGQLGVHQVYGEGVSASDAQVVLSDVLEALNEFGVPQAVISAMLRTKPDEMHIFTASELDLLRINREGAATPDGSAVVSNQGAPSKTVGSSTSLGVGAGEREPGHIAYLSERTLCQWAIDFNTREWSTAATYLPYVFEAQHRGYSAEFCASFLTPQDRGL